MSILKDEWSPGITIDKGMISSRLELVNLSCVVMEHLVNALANPEAENPLNADVHSEFKNNYREFERKAREQTRQYARPPL